MKHVTDRITLSLSRHDYFVLTESLSNSIDTRLATARCERERDCGIIATVDERQAAEEKRLLTKLEAQADNEIARAKQETDTAMRELAEMGTARYAAILDLLTETEVAGVIRAFECADEELDGETAGLYLGLTDEIERRNKKDGR